MYEKSLAYIFPQENVPTDASVGEPLRATKN